MNRRYIRLTAALSLIVLFICSMTTAFACTNCIDISNGVLPSAGYLHQEAYLLGNSIVGRTLHVLRSGYVRSQPNQSAAILTEVHPDDKVAILDYQMVSVNPLDMWLKIDFYGLEGWVNASRGEVVSCPADPYQAGSDWALEAARNRYKGQPIMINVRSGNARAGVGQGYPTIEYVHQYDSFIVQDVALDDNGAIWYQIRIGSRGCWIHSNLATYMGS